MRRTGRVLLAIIVGLLWVSTGWAYSLREDLSGRPLLWAQRELSVQIDTRGAKGLPGAADEVRAAVASWTAAGMPFVVTLSESNSGGCGAADGQNVVCWVEDDWEFGEETLGITISIYEKVSARVVESDILINRQDHRWSTGRTHEDRFDLRSVLTHEFGHFFGLGHSSEAEATMWAETDPADDSKRSLQADDRAGIAALIAAMASAQPSDPPASVSPKADPPRPVSAEVPNDKPDLVTYQEPPSVLPERRAVGCALAGTDSGGGATLFLMLALVLWWRTTRRQRYRVLLLVLVFFGTPALAIATTARLLSLPALAGRAEVVLVGQVEQIATRQARGLIYREITLRTLACLKGKCAVREFLHSPGGERRGFVMHVPGAAQFVTSTTVVVYGRRVKGSRVLRPLGLAQGVFHLEGQSARRDLRGMCLVGPRATHLHRGVERFSLAQLGLGYFKGRILRLSK